MDTVVTHGLSTALRGGKYGGGYCATYKFRRLQNNARSENTHLNILKEKERARLRCGSEHHILGAKMTFPTDDDDDLDVDALRLAALQSLKKTVAPPAQNSSSLSTVHNVASGPRVMSKLGPNQHPNRGRGRGVPNRRGGRGRGGFQNFGNNQNFFPRPSGNSNLITIVPTVPDDPDTAMESQQSGLRSMPCSTNKAAVNSSSNAEEKVPSKFSRLDDNSDSEESDDDPHINAESDADSSGEDEDDKESGVKGAASDSESEKDPDFVSLQHEEDEEDDNSLEKLMRELEDEISETPKDAKKPVVSVKDKPKTDKLSRVKKTKKVKPKKIKNQEAIFTDDHLSTVSSTDVPDGPGNSRTDKQLSLDSQKNMSTSPTNRESLRRVVSPRVTSPSNQRLPPLSSVSQRAVSPLAARSPVKSRSPLRVRSPRRSRSPTLVKSRSPQRLRSPLRSRSPRRSRSPLLSRSPRRSPPRSHYPARSPNYAPRSRSRSPYRSPRRSPHYLARPHSPGRLPPIRSRSRSPRYRSRSPVRARSRTPLGALRRSHTPSRRQSPFRRSRSPGGRLYSSRRSRSISPRVPLGSRRSPSPRRRSPLYLKKLSPKRRSISPRRRSLSPRRRSVSPKRRPLSPGWSRQSPPRNRSPVGSFNQRPLSPRRRSPYGDTYSSRRSPSPVLRKYTPPVSHRAGSPVRNYRSPSPMSRPGTRRRSPAPVTAPLRRSSPQHRAPSPVHRHSSHTRGVGSPSRIRDKPRQISPPPAVSRNNQRIPSPKRQRSPVSHVRGHHSKMSPVRKVSPKRSRSPPKETVVLSTVRGASPIDSISLSPSPERQPVTKLEDRSRARKSHPLSEGLGDTKRSRSDLRNVLPRRKDVPKDTDASSSTRDEESKKERKERRRAKREREKQKRESQGANHVLEARRRKFESSQPVEVSGGKKIRLRNMVSEPTDLEEEEEVKDAELNIEKEKERELKEVNDVDESILDRELMGGVDLLWSDEEEMDEEEESNVKPAPTSSNVQFKRTFNLSSSGTGKENIPDDSNDSKKDEDEEPTSTTGSPIGHQIREDSDQGECDEADSDFSGDNEHREERDGRESYPKTNRELKEYILSQAKGSAAPVRLLKMTVKEVPNKCKSNESDDLRAELSRRRAERQTKDTKVSSCSEALPGRLLQSALQGAGVKSRRDKVHRRRTPTSFEDEYVESTKESSSVKIGGKLPIHLRLGTGKKGDDSPKKVKLKRNITVGRKNQVLCVSNIILCLLRFMVLLHAFGLEQPISCGKSRLIYGLTDHQAYFIQSYSVSTSFFLSG
ncbi:serine/arginine repetitive matrix protein 2 isoform X2 [Frankliniella occidentalis]|uniref:Serine/arginine repetitive matrix protein 2 isoform X2 n=1 Tax=Frankliniella occidentalis TaxID=133901 RepID=A0A9C6X3C4_FRAOC|nr:serine/arginine repetitive matrix protein 2 isoform X2 [Frankliniella occidentalis]